MAKRWITSGFGGEFEVRVGGELNGGEGGPGRLPRT